MSTIRADPFALRDSDDAYSFDILKGDVERLVLALARLKKQVAGISFAGHAFDAVVTGVPSVTSTTLTIAANYDTDGGFDSSTTYTIKTAGLWRISAFVTQGWSTGSSPVGTQLLSVTINPGSAGAITASQTGGATSGTGAYNSVAPSGLVKLGVGDVVSISALSQGSSSNSLSVSGRLTGTWVRAV